MKRQAEGLPWWSIGKKKNKKQKQNKTENILPEILPS